MNLLNKLFGSAAGGVADAAVKTASGVADIVERWAPSEAAKSEMQAQLNAVVQQNVASARSYDPRTLGGGWVGEIINLLVDAASRIIRPGVTILLIGGVFGWWPVQTQTIDPIVLHWAEATIIFWFGARTLFKDLPSLLKYIKGLKD